MITGSLLSKLTGIAKYTTIFIGAIQLKGKHDGTEVYAINKTISWSGYTQPWAIIK